VGVLLLGAAAAKRPLAGPVRFVVTSSTARPVMAATWPAVISPDGQVIVYAGEAGVGDYQFYVRRIDEIEGRPIPGTVHANMPVFSPDGRWVAFEGGGQLFKLQLDGGTAVPIVAANALNGAAWSGRGEIILGSEGATNGLSRVSDGGGPLRVLTTPETKTDTYHLWPVILADGKSILFTIGFSNGMSNRASRLALTSLDDGIVHPLGVEGVRALGVVDNRLLYLTIDGNVMAIAFNARRKRVSGNAVPLLDSIPLCRYCNGDAPVTLSTGGALAYIRGQVASRLTWVDQTGAARTINSREAAFESPRVSPDGKRIAVTILDHVMDIWILEIATSTWTRLTAGGNNSRPEWTADGKNIVFVSDRGKQIRAWRQAADFVGLAEPLTPPIDGLKAVMQSRDGSALLLTVFQSNVPEIWSMPLAGKHVPTPIISGPDWISLARLSPDGSQVAYASQESGGREVYIHSFTSSSGRVQVSSGGGSEPTWSSDGRRIFYVSGRRLMTANISPPPAVRVLSRDSLFMGDGFGDFTSATYDVAPAGDNFLMLHTEDRGVQLVVALNWINRRRLEQQ
jgi:Tol biopolymer transport system component